MGAYFQNQVETNLDQGKELFIQEGALVKFVECQYTSHPCFTNVVRRLSTRTDEDNLGKVWCVCDYDESQNGEYVRKWVSNKNPPVPTKLQNKFYAEMTFDQTPWICEGKLINGNYSDITENKAGFKEEDDIIEDGLLTGFVVSATSEEYIDIDKIVKLTEENLSQNPPRPFINPIAMLTRHSKYRMGGGDLDWDEKEYPEMDNILARWYNDDMYWTHNRPSDYEDITDLTLWYEDGDEFLCKPLFKNVTAS